MTQDVKYNSLRCWLDTFKNHDCSSAAILTNSMLHSCVAVPLDFFLIKSKEDVRRWEGDEIAMASNIISFFFLPRSTLHAFFFVCVQNVYSLPYVKAEWLENCDATRLAFKCYAMAVVCSFCRLGVATGGIFSESCGRVY